MLQHVRDLLQSLYWRSCQYPWYIFVNLGLAVLFYAISLRYGKKIRRAVLRRLFGTSGDQLPYIIREFLNLFIPYIFLSIAVIVIPMPFLLNKGIIFNVLGCTLFYWFLLFPINLLINVVRKTKYPKQLRLPVIIIAVALIACLLLSVFYFPNQIKEVHLTFKTDKLKHNVRIVHLSDIHAEHYGATGEKITRIINRYDPDIILTTGDMFITPYRFNQKGFNAVVKVFKDLNTKYGIVLVNGHHDFNEAYHIVDAMPDKIILLKEQWHTYNQLGISVFGTNLASQITDFDTTVNNNYFRIYLAHKPSAVKNIKEDEFDLALFGHTHAGQVYVPMLTELIVGKYRHGLYKYHGIPIYVNAGIGLEGYLAPRIRWFTYPEVVIIDLVPIIESN